MIAAATNESVDVARGKIVIGTHLLDNFNKLITQQPVLWRDLGNSFF
jgi:lactose/L-arabinose transport system permease protein